MTANSKIRVLVGHPVESGDNPGNHTYDAEQIQIGLRIGSAIAKERSVQLWIATETKDTFERSREIRDAVGQSRVDALRKGKRATFEGLPIQLWYPRNKNEFPSGVVVAIHPGPTLLDTLHGPSEITAEIVVPWHDQWIRPWVDTWGPRHWIGESVTDLPRREFEDPEVLDAVNQSLLMTSSHPNDKKRARERFGALRRRGKIIDGAAIRAHALRDSGWSPAEADQLVKIAVGRQSNDLS